MRSFTAIAPDLLVSMPAISASLLSGLTPVDIIAMSAGSFVFPSIISSCEPLLRIARAVIENKLYSFCANNCGHPPPFQIKDEIKWFENSTIVTSTLR
jgi:hypothetical protein